MELGYGIGSRWWGKGITAEAGRALVKFFFEEVKVKRVYAKHAAGNPNSGSMNVITLEVTTTEQEKITVSENEWSFFTMNEEEITYLTDVFGKRNIEFVCEIQPDEEIDEDEEF